MAWLGCLKSGSEFIFEEKPKVYDSCLLPQQTSRGNFTPVIQLPKGSIKKLIGRDQTWEDEPVELKDE